MPSTPNSHIITLDDARAGNAVGRFINMNLSYGQRGPVTGRPSLHSAIADAARADAKAAVSEATKLLMEARADRREMGRKEKQVGLPADFEARFSFPVVNSYGLVVPPSAFAVDEPMRFVMSHEWSDMSIMGAGLTVKGTTADGTEFAAQMGEIDESINPAVVSSFVDTYNLYMRYGIMPECSVGCIIRRLEMLDYDDDDEDNEFPGAWGIVTEAEGIETSSVFRGAVPGTSIRLMRRADTAQENAMALAAGIRSRRSRR